MIVLKKCQYYNQKKATMDNTKIFLIIYCPALFPQGFVFNLQGTIMALYTAVSEVMGRFSRFLLVSKLSPYTQNNAYQ